MKPFSTYSDVELFPHMKKGDRQAFTEFYNRHSPTLIRNLMRLVKNETLVEEIVHDSFVELWERREQIDPEKSVLAYVYRMASNKAANLFKRAAHDQKLRSYFLRMLDAGYEEIETKLIQKENRELLHQLLERLPPRQREVYMLCKLDGMSYAEVASRLHISESMVNSHIQRANKFLRQQLAKYPNAVYSLLLMDVYSIVPTDLFLLN